MLQFNSSKYGRGDKSYQAAGGEHGIRKLVDCFYDCMREDPEYRRIWDWHPDSGDKKGYKEESREKLARFLCGWMGGPNRYQEKYGPINIPSAHSHLSVTTVERDMWLGCMSQALESQDYPKDFKTYLLEQLSRPAEVIRQACEKQL